jgi:hypothetical protein
MITSIALLCHMTDAKIVLCSLFHSTEFIDITIYVLYFNLANFNAGNPRVTPEVTRDVYSLARIN